MIRSYAWVNTNGRVQLYWVLEYSSTRVLEYLVIDNVKFMASKFADLSYVNG